MNIRTITLTLLLAFPGAVSFAQMTALTASTEATASTVTTEANTVAAPRMAVVELSSIYMRADADYESPLETQELMGTVVEIVGEKGYWREILSPQPYRAWCTELGIVEMSEGQINDYLKADKLIYTGLYGHIYECPSTASPTVCDLVGGDILRTVKAGKRWTEVMLPSGKCGFVQSAELRRHEGFRSIAKGEGDSESISDKKMESIIATALTLKGVPYLWGGMTPKGADCSGLVRWSYLMNGILLPRNASQIIFCGDEVEVEADAAFWDAEARADSEAFLAQMLKRTSKLQRGDLLFFGTPATAEKGRRVTHIGIYLGNGKMIHSSHLVRINSLIPSAPDYYENGYRLLAARRL